jgi:hypothetical protein
MEYVDEGNLTNLINCYPVIVFSEGEILLVISQVRLLLNIRTLDDS